MEAKQQHYGTLIAIPNSRVKKMELCKKKTQNTHIVPHLKTIKKSLHKMWLMLSILYF
jgi:hypothetical protein